LLRQKARLLSRRLAEIPSLYWLFLYVVACLGFGLIFWAFLSDEFFHANITREPVFNLTIADLRVDLQRFLFESHTPASMPTEGQTVKLDRVVLRFDNGPDLWANQGVLATVFFSSSPNNNSASNQPHPSDGWISLSLIPYLAERPFRDPPQGVYIRATSCTGPTSNGEQPPERNCGNEMQTLKYLLGRPELRLSGPRSTGPRPIIVDLPPALSRKLFMSLPSAASGIQHRDVTNSLSRMLYFSATTITTVGFGDIVPLTDRARILVGLEAITGILIIGLFLNALAHEISAPDQGPLAPPI